jgi:hypothetical protein
VGTERPLQDTIYTEQCRPKGHSASRSLLTISSFRQTHAQACATCWLNTPIAASWGSAPDKQDAFAAGHQKSTPCNTASARHRVDAVPASQQLLHKPTRCTRYLPACLHNYPGCHCTAAVPPAAVACWLNRSPLPPLLSPSVPTPYQPKRTTQHQQAFAQRGAAQAPPLHTAAGTVSEPQQLQQHPPLAKPIHICTHKSDTDKHAAGESQP